MYNMSLVHLRIKPGQTCQHMHTGNPTKPLTSLINLIKSSYRFSSSCRGISKSWLISLKRFSCISKWRIMEVNLYFLTRISHEMSNRIIKILRAVSLCLLGSIFQIQRIASNLWVVFTGSFTSVCHFAEDEQSLRTLVTCTKSRKHCPGLLRVTDIKWIMSLERYRNNSAKPYKSHNVSK